VKLISVWAVRLVWERKVFKLSLTLGGGELVVEESPVVVRPRHAAELNVREGVIELGGHLCVDVKVWTLVWTCECGHECGRASVDMSVDVRVWA
jgi:hypothetical protein